MNGHLYKDLCVDWNVMSTSTGLDIPLRINESPHGPETANDLVTDKDLSEREEGWPLIAKNEDESHLLEQSCGLSSWDIAKCSLYLTPIWFATEVTCSFLYHVFFVYDLLYFSLILNYAVK